MVLDAVNEMHRHVTADQIYTFIKEKYPSIGRGTVYRNLGILVEEGKVRKVEVPDGSDTRKSLPCGMRKVWRDI